jgi:hypothetical protein
MSTASLRRTVLRAALGLTAATVVAVGLLGCQPEPSPTTSPVTSPTSASTPSAPAASPTPTETAQAGSDIALPTACEELYSPAMLSSLQEQAPLNDPGVTMTSTQNVEALEILTSGVPTLRCSWGVPSETGLATNVTLVDAAQSAALATALTAASHAARWMEARSARSSRPWSIRTTTSSRWPRRTCCVATRGSRPRRSTSHPRDTPKTSSQRCGAESCGIPLD